MVTNIGVVTIDLYLRDVRGFDDLTPLFGLVCNELPEVGRRERKHGAADVGKPRPDLGVRERDGNLLDELVDDLGGRVLGHTDAVPAADFIAWHELGHDRG